MTETEIKFWTAIVTAIAALIVAVITHVSSRTNQRAIEELRNKYVDAQAERNSRRDYEYEARKRLYQECGPVLFQLAEFSEAAYYRIIGLAQTASRGDLNPGRDSFLREEYYRLSTLYRLLAPSAALKILQRRLTLVDLSLDLTIQRQYTLIRQAFFAFSDEFTFSRLGPEPLDYNPFDSEAESKARKEPSVYWRQGLPLGVVESAIEAILAAPEQRVMTYAEFEADYNRENTRVRENFDGISFLIEDFHPRTRPVFWRMLVTQSCVYRVLSQPHALDSADWGLDDLRIPDSERLQFDWRSPSDTGVDDAIVFEPLPVAEMYFREKLAPRLERIVPA
jgi:hypothetical protein